MPNPTNFLSHWSYSVVKIEGDSFTIVRLTYYADDPQVINAIAIQLKLEPPKVLEHARYLKLRVPNSRHAWTEAELMLPSIPTPELSCNSVGQKSNIHKVNIWIGGFHISLIYSQSEHLGMEALIYSQSEHLAWRFSYIHKVNI